MGILDYERYDKILFSIDNYGVQAIQDQEFLLPYFGSIRQFWRQLRAVLLSVQSDDLVKLYDQKFEDAAEEIRKYIQAYKSLVRIGRDPALFIDNRYRAIIDNLGILNNGVLYIKQNVGLGIMLHKDETFDTRLKRGLGLEK